MKQFRRVAVAPFFADSTQIWVSSYRIVGINAVVVESRIDRVLPEFRYGYHFRYQGRHYINVCSKLPRKTRTAFVRACLSHPPEHDRPLNETVRFFTGSEVSI